MHRYNAVYNEDRTRVSRFGYGYTPVYDLDAETGLPKAPEGYYFKVGSSVIRYWLEVRLMKKRSWWFDQSLSHCSIPASAQDTVTSADILWAALSAMEDWEKQTRERNAPRPPKPPKVKPVDNSRWLGKYPPKTLKKEH